MTGSPDYIINKHIDRSKWDACIDKASNGLIYAYSWYLDHMAKHWDALVLGDYEAVMPLTWNRKYGIAYLYQPFLCAQLGVFGNAPDAATIQQFINAIPTKFRYWDIYLNQHNAFTAPGAHVYERRNYVLDLARPYEQLHAGYRDNIQRNVKKAIQMGCTPTMEFDASQVVELAKSQMRGNEPQAAENMERFTRLYNFLKPRGQAMTYGILSARNQLIASCIFTFSHNRAYYILVGNHPDGRTLGASHALIDSFIKEHAGKNLLLDFEGSDIRNLAFFYSSFGAIEEKYPGLRANKLPLYLKWLKK